MVELFEQNIRTQARQSSKGNQLKWENDNIWYKADYTGYEGLAEYMISHLLMKSSLQDAEYVLYEPEQIQYKSQIYQGVKSISSVRGVPTCFKNSFHQINVGHQRLDQLFIVKFS